MADELRLRWGLQPGQTHASLGIFRGEKVLAQIDLASDSVLQAIQGLNPQLKTLIDLLNAPTQQQVCTGTPTSTGATP